MALRDRLFDIRFQVHVKFNEIYPSFERIVPVGWIKTRKDLRTLTRDDQLQQGIQSIGKSLANLFFARGKYHLHAQARCHLHRHHE